MGEHYFLAHIEELIERLYTDLALLRHAGENGRARRDAVAKLFRDLHSLKGTAGVAGAAFVARLAHQLETLLDDVRANRIELNTTIIDLLEIGIDATADSFRRFTGASDADDHQLNATEKLIKDKLQTLRATADFSSHKEEGVATSNESAWREMLDAAEQQHLRQIMREGASVFHVVARFPLASFDADYRRFEETLRADGEIVKSAPLTPDTPSLLENIGFQLLYATLVDRESLSQRYATANVIFTLLQEGEPELNKSDEEASSTREELSSLVRVDLRELDELIRFMHELFGDALNIIEGVSIRSKGANEGTQATSDELRDRFAVLANRFLRLRMVPIRVVLEHAMRAARIDARLANKEVEWTINDNDVTLDKPLADRLAEPLLHLLRNAIDHGIEPAEERRRIGKPTRGRLNLDADVIDNNLIVRVEDDGRGIDSEIVRRAAVEKGMVSPEASFAPDEHLQIIFHQGFTTIENRTHTSDTPTLSGRGVGLDAVNRTVEELSGEVRVQSTAGAGTIFEMHVPTTLAIDASMREHRRDAKR